MGKASKPKINSLAFDVLTGGLAASVACVFTNPMEVAHRIPNNQIVPNHENHTT